MVVIFFNISGYIKLLWVMLQINEDCVMVILDLQDFCMNIISTLICQAGIDIPIC